MSHDWIQRYRLGQHGNMEPIPDGDWVPYSTYGLLRQQYTDLVQERGETIDALQAELEHLKTRPTLADQYRKYAAMQAQLERLRAAGDQMLGTMLWAAAKNPDGPAEKRILAWINARDGNEEAAK